MIFKSEHKLTPAVKKVLSEQLAALWLSGGLTQDLVDSCCATAAMQVMIVRAVYVKLH